MNSESLHTIPANNWVPKPSKPIIIAGPCSAESEQQIMIVAEHFATNDKVQLIRAGVWKPRTRPNSFEGMGVRALPWLQKAQQEFGIKFTIEVAKAEHVKAALDAGIEFLWIGARTTVNPFSVQEIADALKGADIPVFVKNPINPDIQLWIGAMERLIAVGINKIAAVHRGFNTYNDPVYRNSPNWEIPIDLKTRFPNLDIIVDPSHIGGTRPLIQPISQKALDLGFDGLMIETHPDPTVALSDAKQQIALSNFNALIDSLELKQKHFQDQTTLDELAQLRKMIDEIDHHLIENLKKRADIVQKIGEYKAAHGVTVFQVERWTEIMKDRMSYGADHNLDSDLIKGIWNGVHQSSIQSQTLIATQKLAEKE